MRLALYLVSMKTLTLAALTLVLSPLLTLPAQADYNLASKKGAVYCDGGDNSSVLLSADRKKITYTIEGEKQTFRVTSQDGDGDTSISFIAKSTSKKSGFTLTLSDRGDNFEYEGDSEPTGIRCE